MLDTPISKQRYVFDLETDGFLEVVTKIHCAVLYDIDTDEIHDFKPNQIGEFLTMYQAANQLIGHNIIGFDIPVIRKLYGIECVCKDLIDTMSLGRLVFSDVKAIDFPLAKAWKKYREAKETWEAEQVKPVCKCPASIYYDDPEVECSCDLTPTVGDYPYSPPKEFPGQLVGSHSLEAWGYRIGTEKKGDYSKDMKARGLDPWAEWNPEMHEYMIQDARVNVAVLRKLMSKEPYPLSIQIEMGVQQICTLMEQSGWPFEVTKARELYATLQQRRNELEVALVEAFPPWRVRLEDFIPKRDNKTQGYIKGVPVERWETRTFNPASRQDIADRLIQKYGWKPTEFTDGGQAKIDDEVLAPLPYPEAKLLSEYFTIQKRIGQIGEGPQAWLSKVSKDGKIHARYNSNGAVTGRATHSSPNIAQVPSVGKIYGKECRELFYVPKTWGSQLGADQSGLELRCLASFMAAFDGGKYRDVVLNGDVHWVNAKALFGLPDDLERDETNKEHKTWRDVAKTFIYAFLYGAGDAKLGSIIGKGRQEGSKLRARFLKTFPALAKLIKAVQAAAKKGWLKGLDGRVIPVRSEHAALNSLLQSAGAVVCKNWLILIKENLDAAGLKHGWDGDYVFLAFVHDEFQVAVRDRHIDAVTEALKDAGRRAGDVFTSWDCPTEVDVKLGHNWAECH